MKAVISWFVDNPVAANLLMWILVVGGLVSLPSILVEEFPPFETDTIQIQVPYPGAAPDEVESGVCKRLEEAVDGLEGIEKIDTNAYEGQCVVHLEVAQGASMATVTRDVEAQINAITTLPVDAERPIVTELQMRSTVINVALSGDIDAKTMKELGEQIRDEMASLPEVSQVDLMFTKDYEISVEVSEADLERYGLTLAQVGRAIEQDSRDIAGGSLRTQSGEILVRSLGQAYTGKDLEDVAVKSLGPDGVVRLKDIATIRDGFVVSDQSFEVDDVPAVMLKVSRTGDGNLLRIARHVRNYIQHKQVELPHGVDFKVWKDESEDLIDRLRVLGRNAGGGLLLVLLILALFLQPRVAFWVAIGLPVAMIGTLLLFPNFDISISTVSIMAFILVLGILVDDAIVVGERVHAYEERGYSLRDSAVLGTQEVSTPVIFGVLTTMAAFMPLVLSGSGMSTFTKALGGTAMVALVMSIVESQMILPAHLSHRRHEASGDRPAGSWTRFQSRMEKGMHRLSKAHYQPALKIALQWRYLTVSIAIALISITFTLFASGRMVFQFFPAIEADQVYATLVLPPGTPAEILQREASKLERAAHQLRAELDANNSPNEASNISRILTAIGGRVQRGSIDMPNNAGSANYVELVLELLPYDQRDSILPSEIARRWRELTEPIPDIIALTYTANFMSLGDPIDIRLRGRDISDLQQAAELVKQDLRAFDGVSDIVDSFRSGKQEVKLRLRDEARHLGLSMQDLGSQVRHAFYGAEAQRVQRGREDIRIMVRHPLEERRSLDNLQNMHIRTEDGQQVALGNVAELELGRGFSSIKRLDRQRIISVTADVDRNIVEPERILQAMLEKTKPAIEARFPSVEYSLGGEAEESAASVQELTQLTLIALLLIYALLAIPLQSYIQPLIIMSVIPFGAVGAIVGHFLLGRPLVFFSMLGIVALAGVVINGSLVLVDTINRLRRQGVEIQQAVVQASLERFRPIVLTSLTTFVGLAPLIANENPTTSMITPMAVSLSFGVIFAVFITLFLVPSLYLILAEAKDDEPGSA